MTRPGDARRGEARPLSVRTDLSHGGRWTSLATPEREWLWHNPVISSAARAAVVPGDPFVDAGGVEECFPTINGPSDHGEVWSRPWAVDPAGTRTDPSEHGAASSSGHGGPRGGHVGSDSDHVGSDGDHVDSDSGHAGSRGDHVASGSDHGASSGSGPGTGTVAQVQAAGLTLDRRLTAHDGVVRAAYTISGEPGTGLLHAVHMLLDVGPGAHLEVPGRPDVLVVEWPEPGVTTSTTWPDGGGVPLDVLGPDDGTARCAVVATDQVDVVDGTDRLSLRWGVEHGYAAPVSLVVWRNLGGWPDGAPYRSIGVEPLLGAETNRDRTNPAQLAHLNSSGRIGWWLEARAGTRQQ